MINISNFTSENKSSGWPAQPATPADPPRIATISQVGVAERTAPRSVGGRLGHLPVIVAGVLACWLAAIPRRVGDRLFAMNDNEAYWRGWQITRVHGGLGRSYRDPRFDTLAECPKCQGAGLIAKAPCVPCLGTGRITLDEVS